MFYRSIRWQIQLWHGLLLALITGSLLFGFYRYQETIRLQELDNRLETPLLALLPRHVHMFPGPGQPPPFGPPPGAPQDAAGDFPPGPPPGGDGPPDGPPPGIDHAATPGAPSTARPSMEKMLEARGTYMIFWSSTGEELYRSPNAPALIPRAEAIAGEPRAYGRWNGPNYEHVLVTPHGEAGIMGTSGDRYRRGMGGFALDLTFIGLGVIVVGLAGGWWLAGRAIRPIAKIAAAAESIASGDLTRRIALKRGDDELSRLAAVLDTTFDRLAEGYERQVRFTADASHELRTPVTVILAQTQMALSRERAAAEYREALEVCRRSALRMKGLLGELIELSRHDSAQPAVTLRDCDLADVVRDALLFVAPLATERHAVITEEIESLPGRFDPVHLGQAFINLITNAIKHNAEGCAVHVTLRRAGDRAQFVVADSGQGIPADSLPHIFDRFYRVDQARSRATGGSGLGLSIVKAIVEAHGGSITVVSVPGEGATFTITLPVVAAMPTSPVLTHA